MTAGELELVLPESAQKMRTAHVPDILSMDPGLLTEAPLVVSYTKGRVLCLYDEPALKAIYRDRWPAISAILSESDPRSAHRELIALEQEGRLSAADVKILRSAEGALFDSLLPGDSSAPQALAKLVALLVRHKIAAAAGR